MTMPNPKSLSADLYDERYYEHSLPGKEYADNPNAADPAFEHSVRFGNIRPRAHVLDFGCGRGTCALALARMGCRVIGTDFSEAAVRTALGYRAEEPEAVRKRVEFRKCTADELAYASEFDVIVFHQVYEHLHGWELIPLLEKFKRALKPGGTVVISTPNLNYIRYLYPLKRTLELPFKAIKELLRILRGKSRHVSGAGAFFREIFKVRYPESEHTKLHINLQTPASLRSFLKAQGFEAHAACVDPHRNVLTWLARRWWGETIWAAAKVKLHR